MSWQFLWNTNKYHPYIQPYLLTMSPFFRTVLWCLKIRPHTLQLSLERLFVWSRRPARAYAARTAYNYRSWLTWGDPFARDSYSADYSSSYCSTTDATSFVCCPPFDRKFADFSASSEPSIAGALKLESTVGPAIEIDPFVDDVDRCWCHYFANYSNWVDDGGFGAYARSRLHQTGLRGVANGVKAAKVGAHKLAKD